MEQIRFSICRIDAGGFEVYFWGGDGPCACASASDVWSNDGPGSWLALLAGGKSGYVAFDWEPGAYILALDRGRADVLTVACTGQDSIDWPVPATGALSYQELARQVPIKRVAFQGEIDFPMLAHTTYKAFLPYTLETLPQLRQKYEGNWMPFPQTAWEEFQRLVLARGWDVRPRLQGEGQNPFQQKVLRAIAAQQAQAVELARARYALGDGEADMLYDVTGELLLQVMALIDGYVQGDIQLDLVNRHTGQRLKEEPFLELHDALAEYLRQTGG